MTLKTTEQEGEQVSSGKVEYVFDTEYIKKMLAFHKNVNEQEECLGVYISTTVIDEEAMTVIAYFNNLFKTKKVRSPLQAPIIMLFDPELNNNKLDIKVSD